MDDVTRQRIEQFKYFVTVDPDGEISHFGLGKAYFDAGTLAEGRADAVEAVAMFAEAIVELRKVLTIKPDYAACFLFLGLSQQKSGDKTGAMKTYQDGMLVAQKNGDLHLRKRMWDQTQILEGKMAPPPPPGVPGKPPETGPSQIH